MNVGLEGVQIGHWANHLDHRNKTNISTRRSAAFWSKELTDEKESDVGWDGNYRLYRDRNLVLSTAHESLEFVVIGFIQ